MKQRQQLTYADAGAGIEEVEDALKKIQHFLNSTYGPGVISRTGTFAAFFAPKEFPDWVVGATIDGIGTRALVEMSAEAYRRAGESLVAHSANDLLCHGLRPMFFLNYIGGSHPEEILPDAVRGMATLCARIRCPMVGGETAKMPQVYRGRAYDLVGAMFGMVEREHLITGERVQPGDVVIGLPSLGLHTNGYSLARKVLFEVIGLSGVSEIPGQGTTVREELLKPHKCYLESVWRLLKEIQIHGIAHITGGGLPDNIRRILPEKCQAVIRRGSWDILPIFTYLEEAGNIEEREMFHVFNMGIGMVLVVAWEDQERVLAKLEEEGEHPSVIGEIIAGNRGVEIA